MRILRSAGLTVLMSTGAGWAICADSEFQVFTCTFSGTVCGDGLVQGEERCDDRDTDAGDGCAADCLSVEPGWTCFIPAMGGDGSSVCMTECGDGVIAGDETCEGQDFGGDTCESLGLGAGDLACAMDCTTDTSGCMP